MQSWINEWSIMKRLLPCIKTACRKISHNYLNPSILSLHYSTGSLMVSISDGFSLSDAFVWSETGFSLWKIWRNSLTVTNGPDANNCLKEIKIQLSHHARLFSKKPCYLQTMGLLAVGLCSFIALAFDSYLLYNAPIYIVRTK